MIQVISNLTREQEGEIRRGGKLLERRDAHLKTLGALKDENLNVEGLFRELHGAVQEQSETLVKNERKDNQAASAQARSWKEDVRFQKPKTYQHRASIPADEYFAFATSKPGCWEDPEFTRDYLKRNPHLKSND
tara:strand:+ start:10115 stop:10516 length:402 start_codon:yes stop_codon:yes gene_type:complete